MNRRDFVAASAAAVAAGRLPSAVYRLPSARLGRIGVQLYTLRREMQRDFDGTLARVAAIGYREVEFAGYFGRTPPQVRAVLDRHRLTAPSSHIPIELLSGDWARMLADARVMGHRYLVVAWMPQAMRRALDDWRRIAELFTRAGEAARREGITFAYHNHDFEFTPLEGRLPFDVLLESSDPREVKIEVDLYWIRKGGHDAVAYFRRWPGRFPMVHVKDMAADGRMVDVGAGAIDWRAIFSQRRRAGIRHYFIEHDEPEDPVASITASYQYLSRLDV